MEPKIKSLAEWVKFFGAAEIPMLKRTARELAILQADTEQLSVRAVTEVVTHDPLLTVVLLRYLQRHKRNTQLNEVVQIEQALLMLGMQTFFDRVKPALIIETVLSGQIVGLTGLLQAVRRAIQAANYAKDWAVHLQDLHFDEIYIAALLHNFAEILMWCYASGQMTQIQSLQLHDSGLRTHEAQQQILGFEISDLQLSLAKAWALPTLLIGFMNGDDTKRRQMRIIVLAVQLARHAMHGWDNAALPDDYKQIGELLNMQPAQVMLWVHR
ncbi:MAG: HDOD domain-containing protein [Sulfuriferula sp.]